MASVARGTLSPRRGWEVLRALTVTEIKEERDLSVSGLLRWALEPLSYMIIYTLVLGAVFNRPRYALPLFLLAALVPFRFFTETLFRSMGVVKSYGPILTNRVFPREILPLVVTASNVPTFLLSMLLFVPFMVAYGVPFTPALFWLPVIIVVLLLFAAGPAYLGSLFGLYFPDLRGVVQNLIRVSFFISTGLVLARDVPGDDLPFLFEANPLSSIFDGFRSVILFGHGPTRFDLLYPSLTGTIMLLLGVLLYRRRQSEFAKEV
jgi:ABC-type polysaccharide/polyol phosphate export permease